MVKIQERDLPLRCVLRMQKKSQETDKYMVGKNVEDQHAAVDDRHFGVDVVLDRLDLRRRQFPVKNDEGRALRHTEIG